MKTKLINETIYICEKCNKEYETKEEALSCESEPIKEDRGVKVGDIVKITGGDCKGQRLEVETVYVIDKYWGHYYWKRYWHTIAVTGKCIDSYGGRVLTFDDYETIK